MKTSFGIAIIIVAVAAIVGWSVSSAVREQRRLLDEFTATTQHQVHASIDLLSARLDALDQDTRLLVNLVERSPRNADFDLVTERRIWTTAFQALATVVPQYRCISLFRADGSLEILAGDPTEAQATIDALVEPSRRLAVDVARKSAKALTRPTTNGDGRAFLLYGTPVYGNGGAIVVAADAAVFLGGLPSPLLSAARLFVTDPAGVVWSGCETTRGCRADPSAAIRRVLAGADDDVRSGSASPSTSRPGDQGRAGGGPASREASVPPTSAAIAGLGHTPAIRISERLGRTLGSWTVTWIASAKNFSDRERALLFRLISTAMAAAIAVAGVGMIILRQQRKAVALATELEYAQALASARETSEAIVENAPLGVLGVSRSGKVVLVNRFLVDRLGPIRVGARIDGAFVGEGAEWIAEVAPFLLSAVGVEGAEGGAPSEGAVVSTRSHELHLRVVPVRNHALGVRAFALVEDQSELRKLENQLLRAEKLITVGVLSAGIAHEIGSPLAVIRGRAEQVLRRVSGTPQAEDLRIVIKHIDSISSTIRQLLDFSRRQPIMRQAVSLAPVVEHARDLVRWKLEAKELALRVRLEDDLPLVAADPDQLQQVLVNLLLNACDASYPGKPISLVAHGARMKMVRLEIADDGCGIAAEHMNAVFDPFFTTKKKGEGTGLGLPIVASIVRNHGGEINLSSGPGRGTTVTVLWPTVAAPAETASHA